MGKVVENQKVVVLKGSSGALRFALWPKPIAELWEKMRQALRRDAEPDCSRFVAYSYLALFVPVIAFVVLANSSRNGIIGDTLLMISDFESLERFSSLWSNANSNPLQALFDIFPSGHRLDAIPNIVGRALFGPGMHINFLLVCCAVLLACGVAAMARSVGLRWGVAALGGILLPLLTMPTLGYIPLAEDAFVLWPILCYAAAGTVFITALFWRIDGQSWRRSVLSTGIIIAILVHLSVVMIFHMTMMAPAMLAMGAGALAASTTRKEFVSKVICGAVIVAALAAAGIFQYLHATGVSGAQYVFYQELPNFGSLVSPRWALISHNLGEVFFTPFSPSFQARSNFGGAVIVPLSQLGAIYLALWGPTRGARIFGLTMVVWIVATALLIVFIFNFYYYTGHIYLGPDPRHFLEIFWPFYVICLASFLFAITEALVSLLCRTRQRAESIAKYVPHGLLILSLVAPLMLVAVSLSLHWTFEGQFKFVTPPPNFPNQTTASLSLTPSRFNQRSPIVDYLEPKVGIALDRPFRGTVIFMPTVYDKDVKPYGVWRRETTFTYARWFLGNDLGEYGLRYYNIPTLDELTHNITPQFHLVVRELLSRPGIDVFERHYGGAATRLNEPIMALLGLRYIIADYQLPIGTERFAMPLTEQVSSVFESNRWLKSPVRIYELPNPNLGNYSPTKALFTKTASEAIVAMSRPNFDGRRIVVTDDVSMPHDLVPATEAAMTVRLGGVALSASSAGQSVLVLPVQYSHCWRVVSGEATLFRANVMQLGVRFSGKLQVELRQIFGPFWQSGCREDDAADAERLRMVDALGAVGEVEKTPGNGINLIPLPEALDTAFSSTLASIKSVGPPEVPIREYTISAQGGFAPNRYVTLSVPKLLPGLYTLSMQVRAKGLRFVSLQLKDGGDNGALVDYLPISRNVWINKTGAADKLAATVRKVDDEWFQLTLTSTLLTETGTQILVHLKDKGNDGGFVPNGEAVTIRAVKLEQGETVTPDK
jgi:hypothetical protein